MRDPDDGVLRVIVEPPLPMARGGDTDAALDDAAQVFGARHEPYVRLHPAQWRDWKNLQLDG